VVVVHVDIFWRVSEPTVDREDRECLITSSYALELLCSVLVFRRILSVVWKELTCYLSWDFLAASDDRNSQFASRQEQDQFLCEESMVSRVGRQFTSTFNDSTSVLHVRG